MLKTKRYVSAISVENDASGKYDIQIELVLASTFEEARKNIDALCLDYTKFSHEHPDPWTYFPEFTIQISKYAQWKKIVKRWNGNDFGPAVVHNLAKR